MDAACGRAEVGKKGGVGAVMGVSVSVGGPSGRQGGHPCGDGGRSGFA